MNERIKIKMKRYSRDLQKFVTVLMTSLLCVLVAGCSLGSKDDLAVRGFTDFEHIEQEYLNSLEELEWPEGTVLPTKLTGEDAEQYQIGYGNTRASMLWECAWQKEWIATYNSDPERAEKALQELEKAPDMLYMSPQKCDDATRKYFNDNLEKAKLGDPSGFAENIRLNCPE